MSVSDVPGYHAACKVEFQPPIGRTHSWRFSIFNKISSYEYTRIPGTWHMAGTYNRIVSHAEYRWHTSSRAGPDTWYLMCRTRCGVNKPSWPMPDFQCVPGKQYVAIRRVVQLYSGVYFYDESRVFGYRLLREYSVLMTRSKSAHAKKNCQQRSTKHWDTSRVIILYHKDDATTHVPGYS